MLSSWLFALQYPWLYECFSSKIIRSVRVVNLDRDCRFALKWKIIPMQQLACLRVLHSQRQLNRSSSCHTWSWQVPDGWETSVNGFGSNHVVVLQDNICVQPRGTTQIWCASPYTLQMAKCNKPSRAVLQPDVHFLSRSFFFSPFAFPPLALISPYPCSRSRCPSLPGSPLCSHVTACYSFPTAGQHNPGVWGCVLELSCINLKSQAEGSPERRRPG